MAISIDPPDPAALFDDGDAPPRVVRVQVLEVEKHVPALVSVSRGAEVGSDAAGSDAGREADNG